MITLNFPGASWVCSDPLRIICINSARPWEELKEKLTFEHSEQPWVGFLSYEMGAFAEPNWPLPFKPSSFPMAWFMQPSKITSYKKKHSCPPLPKRNFELLYSEKEYLKKIEIIKEDIRKGDLYQVNLSNQLRFQFPESAHSLYDQLEHRTSASFTACIETDEFSVISLSPERLLKKSGSSLLSEPIKGTAPRGDHIVEDESHLLSLLASEKERAELFMITDLVRNDLGKISEIGSVEVKEKIKLTPYPNVFHLSSEIISRPLDIHAVDMLRAVFPGGSITGCPKRRAIESIYQLEHTPRHIYTGSIGYFTADGNFDFNIAIRTLLIDQGTAYLNLGGGITIDSDPEKEIQEIFHKGKPFFEILNPIL